MQHDPFGTILGCSEAAERIRLFGRKAARVAAPVLLTGESGTGKGVLARAIHQASTRARATFVAVNCAAVPETLFESEFFGHVRGAFTGAQYSHKGLLEQAHGGTLFLDEVVELPLAMQSKLLTVLEDGELRRVGGERTTRVDVRFIAATAGELSRCVGRGSFRFDLFQRLAVLSFELPPLRQRAGDIELLVAQLLVDICRRYGVAECVLTDEALERLRAHSWPGNVRELANVLERAVVMSDGQRITSRSIAFSSRPIALPELHVAAARARYSFAGTPAEERLHIRTVIAKCRGNKTRAAEILGMSRNTLLNKLRAADARDRPA